MKQLARLIATGFYSGYSPFAPGTAGSLLALGFFIIFPGFRGPILLSACILLFFIGVWSGTEMERIKGKDPSVVVIDEIVGMWLALLFLPEALPFFSKLIWWIIVFVVFRVFDIIKPFPAGRSQRLSGGWGIMMDDVIAGIYTNLVLRGIIHFLG